MEESSAVFEGKWKGWRGEWSEYWIIVYIPCNCHTQSHKSAMYIGRGVSMFIGSRNSHKTLPTIFHCNKRSCWLQFSSIRKSFIYRSYSRYSVYGKNGFWIIETLATINSRVTAAIQCTAAKAKTKCGKQQNKRHTERMEKMREELPGSQRGAKYIENQCFEKWNIFHSWWTALQFYALLVTLDWMYWAVKFNGQVLCTLR